MRNQWVAGITNEVVSQHLWTSVSIEEKGARVLIWRVFMELVWQASTVFLWGCGSFTAPHTGTLTTLVPSLVIRTDLLLIVTTSPVSSRLMFLLNRRFCYYFPWMLSYL